MIQIKIITKYKEHRMQVFPIAKTIYQKFVNFLKKKPKVEDTPRVHLKMTFRCVKQDKDRVSISNSKKLIIRALRSSFD